MSVSWTFQSLEVKEVVAHSWVMELAHPQAMEKPVKSVSAARNSVLDPKMLASFA